MRHMYVLVRMLCKAQPQRLLHLQQEALCLARRHSGALLGVESVRSSNNQDIKSNSKEGATLSARLHLL